MNNLFVFVISLLVFSGTTVESPATSKNNLQEADWNENETVYYFIRHTEKDQSDPANKDPMLSDAGLQRAQNWADFFEDVDFDLIFSTDYNRTRKTAKIIAARHNQSVELYDPTNLFSQEFRTRTKRKTVLVVGHSNTNPAFVNKILGRKRYAALDEGQYGSLFVVRVAPDGTTSSELSYHN